MRPLYISLTVLSLLCPVRPVHAQRRPDDGRQVVRLDAIPQIPQIKLKQAAPPVPDERVAALIASLSDIDSPDFGFSDTLSGAAFAPIDRVPVPARCF